MMQNIAAPLVFCTTNLINLDRTPVAGSVRDFQAHETLTAAAFGNCSSDSSVRAVVVHDLLSHSGSEPGGVNGVGPFNLVGNIRDCGGASIGEVKPGIVESERGGQVVGGGRIRPRANSKRFL